MDEQNSIRTGNPKRKNTLHLWAILIVLLAAVVGLVYLLLQLVTPRDPADAMADSALAVQAATEDAGAALAAVNARQDSVEQLDSSLWNTSNRVEQTIDLEVLNPDFRMTGLPRTNAVIQSYFTTVTFVGDSLTQGLQLYETGLPNASYCAYKGIGPNSIVNGAQCQRLDGSTGIPMEDLAATQPDVVYICLGTNTLVVQGNEDSFINYYSAMIDMFRQVLDPRVVYVIQAIPGVQENVVASKPGLDNARIRQVNNMLSKLATEKNCYFLDLQEALSDTSGSQKDEFAASDGIHMKPEGYQAWVDYLSTHTVYAPRNLYVDNDNPFYIPK